MIGRSGRRNCICGTESGLGLIVGVCRKSDHHDRFYCKPIRHMTCLSFYQSTVCLIFKGRLNWQLAAGPRNFADSRCPIPEPCLIVKKSRPVFAALTALLLAGCQTRPNFSAWRESTKYSVENTGKFVRLGPDPGVAVSCTGLQEHLASDGRLEVVANVQNRENRRVQLEVRCVFKDGNGFSTGDETPWRILLLDAGDTEAVRFGAANSLAHTYTIMVREAL